nr:class I mannose-6-phosphate isomerase [Bacilli bacterium]
MERIWGGHDLVARFGDQIDQPIGEYWVLSGHQNGMSRVQAGPYQGKSLVELTEEEPAYLGTSPQKRFPLMIKFLEAKSDLSVQIHPDDTYALAHENDYGKTEAWYVVDCLEQGNVVYGHHFYDQQHYLEAVRQQTVQDHLAYHAIHKGDLVFVPSRTLHALLAGTMVIEVQQTSDITYRVYDWDRVGQDGKPRTLHIEKAGEVMTFPGQNALSQEQPIKTLAQQEGIDHQQIASCAYFSLDKLHLTQSSYSLTLGHEGNPDIIIIAQGEGELIYLDAMQQEQVIPLRFGVTVLIPSTIHGYRIETPNTLTLLRTYY